MVSLLSAFALSRPAASIRTMVTRYQVASVLECGLVLALAAVHWRLARPHPGEVVAPSARQIYRGGTALVAAAKVASLVLTLAAPTSRGVVLANWLGNFGLLAGIIGFFAYLRGLALRVPSDRHARRALALIWSAGGGFSVYMVIGLWVQAARPTAIPLPVAVSAGACGAALVACAVAAAVLLVQLATRFGDASRHHAEANST